MYVPQRSHQLPQPIPDCVEVLAQRASTHRGWDVQSSALLSLDGDSAGTKLIGSLQLRRTAQNASKPATVPQPPPPLQSKNSMFPMNSQLKTPGIAHKNALLGCVGCHTYHVAIIVVKYFSKLASHINEHISKFARPVFLRIIHHDHNWEVVTGTLKLRKMELQR